MNIFQAISSIFLFCEWSDLVIFWNHSNELNTIEANALICFTWWIWTTFHWHFIYSDMLIALRMNQLVADSIKDDQCAQLLLFKWHKWKNVKCTNEIGWEHMGWWRELVSVERQKTSLNFIFLKWFGWFISTELNCAKQNHIHHITGDVCRIGERFSLIDWDGFYNLLYILYYIRSSNQNVVPWYS